MKRPWTKEEITILKESEKKYTTIEVSNILGRTRNSVDNKARKIGVELLKAKPEPWSKEELNFLRENNKNMLPEEMAFYLGRSRIAVMNAAKKHNIGLYKQRAGGLREKVGDNFIRWTPEEDKQLWELSERYNLRQIAKKLGRTRGAVFNRCKKLGISLKQGKLNNLYIAEQLGFKKGIFHKYKRICGLNFLTMENPRNPTRDELHQIIDKISSNVYANVKFSRAKVNQAIDDLPL